MRDQPLGTTRRWEAEPLFPDLFPDQAPQAIEITKPAPHVKLPQSSGTELRDAGMAAAWDNTPGNWKTVALTLLYQLAKQQPEVNADDLQAVLPPLPPGTHHNVIGSLWMEAVRQHFIRHTGRSIVSARTDSHARRVFIYESLVYKGV